MNFSYKLAMFIVGVMALWILSGQWPDANEIGENKKEPEKKMVDVQVKRLMSEPYSKRFRVYGATESIRKVELKAETEGRVEEILAEEGQLLKEGDPILRLDKRDRKAKLLQAQSLVAQKTLDYKAAQSLAKKKLQSETKLAQMLAELDAAKATLLQVEIALDNTVVKAPFDGKIDKITKEVGDVVEAMKDVIATMTTVDPFLVVGHVSEKWIQQIKDNMQVRIALASGKELEDKLTFISSIANPVTRTFRIESEISSPEDPVAEGISAEMEIFFSPVEAHFIPASSMTLDDKGNIGVKIVDSLGKAQFVNIAILNETENGIWVSGLPQQVNLITLGQSFVRSGDAVRVTQYKGEQSSNTISSTPMPCEIGDACESVN